MFLPCIYYALTMGYSERYVLLRLGVCVEKTLLVLDPSVDHAETQSLYRKT